MLILEKFRNKYHQIWITVDGEIRDTKFDCRLKGEKQATLRSYRPSPAPSLTTWLLIIVPNAHLNLFNKCPAQPSTFYSLLPLAPSSAPSQPRLLHSARADAYSFRQGHFRQWRTCWRRVLVYPHRLCWSGRQRLSFLYWLLTQTRKPDTIFSELKLASLKYQSP
jgi:hypothetical protein